MTRISIVDRIQARIELLTSILESGEEDPIAYAMAAYGLELPTSLTKARMWSFPKLGIEKISDPNSFTREHRVHGSLVRQLDRLLLQFKAIDGRPKKRTKSVTTQLAEVREKYRDLERRHATVVSQLAAAHEHLGWYRRQNEAQKTVLLKLRRDAAPNQKRSPGADVHFLDIPLE